jgi:hypothetical protein
MVLRAPLASVAEADAEMAAAEAEAATDPETLWVRAFARVEADLRALLAHARAVGVAGDAADAAEEAEDALRAPVGATELALLRGLQFRESAAQELATALRAAGHASALIAAWAEAGDEERRVRPRLA